MSNLQIIELLLAVLCARPALRFMMPRAAKPPAAADKDAAPQDNAPAASA
jgi:hypothetical protein